MSTPTPTPRRLTAAAAVAAALFVVGAGAAIGIGSTHSGRKGGTSVSAGSPSQGISPGASVSTLASPGGPAATTTTLKGSGPVGSGSSPTSAGTPAAGGSAPVSVATQTTTTIAGSSSSASQNSGLGTYSYATSGQSRIFGKTSPYPSTTTINVTRSGCGESSEWDSSPGNSTTVVACPVTGGFHVVSETDKTDAGGYHMTQTFECSANSFVPLSGPPGTKYKWSCSTSNGETANEVVTIDGPATLTVDGTAVQTEHVSIVSTLSGPESGTADVEDWLSSAGLRIKETGAINASAYGVSYTANYTINLKSLKPS